MSNNLLRRLGIVKVDMAWIREDPEAVRKLLEGAFVLKAEHDFCSDQIAYTVAHPDLDVTPAGAVVPIVKVEERIETVRKTHWKQR